MSHDQAIAEDVQKFSFSIIRISEFTPPFAYTVGLMFTRQHPELIIFGLRDEGPRILRTMAELIALGRRFDAPGEYEGALENGKVATHIVHPTQHEFYLGYAMGYCRDQGCGGKLQAIQVFWPDKQGLFPFQRGCDDGVYEAQPRLDQPIGPIELKNRREERRAKLGI